MSVRILRLSAAYLAAALALPAISQTNVYRCETNGKVAYSDARASAPKLSMRPTRGTDRGGILKATVCRAEPLPEFADQRRQLH